MSDEKFRYLLFSNKNRRKKYFTLNIVTVQVLKINIIATTVKFSDDEIRVNINILQQWKITF